MMRSRVLQALGHIRCAPAGSETDLHAQAAQALLDAGIAAEHEAVLGPRCRIDFFVGEIGIEIKKKRPGTSKAKGYKVRKPQGPKKR